MSSFRRPRCWGRARLIPPPGLIVLVLGSIFAGWATVTEASAVGAAGALLLTALTGRLTGAVLREVVDRTALTVAPLPATA